MSDATDAIAPGSSSMLAPESGPLADTTPDAATAGPSNRPTSTRKLPAALVEQAKRRKATEQAADSLDLKVSGTF
jgi:hypothetical protein